LALDVWTKCLGALEAEFTPQQFHTWLRPLQLSPEQTDGALTLLAPNRFVVEWVKKNFYPRIQELAAEFSGRFKKNRAPLAGLALTTNTSALTAIGNDFGFEEIFSRQLQALANNNDVLVALSTSGNSKNIISAVEKAKALGLKTIGFLGNDGGKLKTLVDLALTITCSDTPSIQEMHILAGHIACSITESKLEG